MASANIHTKQVEKTVIVQEEIVTLELSREEAQLLTDVLSRIGGCPRNSRRKFATEIERVLRENGVEYQSSFRDGEPVPTDIHGQIMIHVEPKVKQL